MGRTFRLERGFAAPLEQVGGALEQAIAAASVWELGPLDREHGRVSARLDAGALGQSDVVSFGLERVAGGETRVEVEIEARLPVAREAPRRAALERLWAQMEGLIVPAPEDGR